MASLALAYAVLDLGAVVPGTGMVEAKGDSFKCGALRDLNPNLCLWVGEG